MMKFNKQFLLLLALYSLNGNIIQGALPLPSASQQLPSASQQPRKLLQTTSFRSYDQDRYHDPFEESEFGLERTSRSESSATQPISPLSSRQSPTPTSSKALEERVQRTKTAHEASVGLQQKFTQEVSSNISDLYKKVVLMIHESATAQFDRYDHLKDGLESAEKEVNLYFLVNRAIFSEEDPAVTELANKLQKITNKSNKEIKTLRTNLSTKIVELKANSRCNILQSTKNTNHRIKNEVCTTEILELVSFIKETKTDLSALEKKRDEEIGELLNEFEKKHIPKGELAKLQNELKAALGTLSGLQKELLNTFDPKGMENSVELITKLKEVIQTFNEVRTETLTFFKWSKYITVIFILGSLATVSAAFATGGTSLFALAGIAKGTAGAVAYGVGIVTIFNAMMNDIASFKLSWNIEDFETKINAIQEACKTRLSARDKTYQQHSKQIDELFKQAQTIRQDIESDLTPASTIARFIPKTATR